MDEKELLIVPVPALVAVLLNAEHEKGAPLIETEVLAIRDNAACIAMPHYAHAKVAAEPGYDDVDPEFVWEDWQQARLSLIGDAA